MLEEQNKNSLFIIIIVVTFIITLLEVRETSAVNVYINMSGLRSKVTLTMTKPPGR